MSKLHIVTYKHAVTNERMISVMVNGFSEMDRPTDDWAIIIAFLASLLEMKVITDEQYSAKVERVRELAGV